MKKFFNDILTNPDNQTFSSKKVAGWVSLIATLVYAFVSQKPDADIMFTLAGVTFTFFGLTSVDYKTIVNKLPPTEVSNSAPGV
jgi:hypothetical protein